MTNDKREQWLEQFTKVKDVMIKVNDNSQSNIDLRMTDMFYKKDYSIQQVRDIIASNDPQRQKELSREFYLRDGFYKQLIGHYTSLINYNGVLIPHPAFGASLQKKSIAKRYSQALSFIDSIKIKKLGQHIANRVLIDGIYYGVITEKTKDSITIMDLPYDYCRSRFQDINGNYLVEFDVRFFDKITDPEYREIALNTYPKSISSFYRKWSQGKRISEKDSIQKDSWLLIPIGEGIAFNLFDSCPYFISVIPASLQYDTAVENEQTREIEEIKKLIVQKIPHLNDGQLLFEPDEASVMHEATAGMLRQSNPNSSVITTYGDVDVYTSKTSDSVTNNILVNMMKHIYAKAGVSPEIFAASGSSSLGTSISYDMSLMMVLANKISIFLTNLINNSCGSTEVQFTYYILPVSEYNKQNMVDMYMKLASSGYSFLLPGIAAGLSQRELCNIKELENNLLKMSKFLLPLSTSYTQSSKKESPDDDTKTDPETGGRPPLDDTQKTEQTVKNIESEGKN